MSSRLIPSVPAPSRVEILPPADFKENVLAALRELAECARAHLPFMVDKAEAARLCGMCPATYDKYVKRKLLPPLNDVGRISVEGLRQACLKLDGITALNAHDDPAERALKDW